MQMGNLFVSLLCLGFCAAPALAENFAKSTKNLSQSVLSSTVKVQVRALKASDMPPEAAGDVAYFSARRAPVSLDSRLSDLRPRLEKLSFRSYRLISDETRSIGLTRREVFIMNDGAHLSVRPLYLEKGKVGMWLKWEDKLGMPLLDTRMQFSPGESFLTGTDHNPASGIILAVDVALGE